MNDSNLDQLISDASHADDLASLRAVVVALVRLAQDMHRSIVQLNSLPIPGRCEQCGSAEEVTYGPDPFSSEIHGDDTDRWLCFHCRYDSAMAI